MTYGITGVCSVKVAGRFRTLENGDFSIRDHLAEASWGLS